MSRPQNRGKRRSNAYPFWGRAFVLEPIIFLLLQNTVTVYTVCFVLPHFFTVQERLLEPSAPLFLRIPAFLGELAFASLTYLDAVAFGHLFELPI